MAKETSCILSVVSPSAHFVHFSFLKFVSISCQLNFMQLFSATCSLMFFMFAQVAPYERPALSKAYLFPECKFVMLIYVHLFLFLLVSFSVYSLMGYILIATILYYCCFLFVS